jgi:uroporphyrinogen-III decarboxylase
MAGMTSRERVLTTIKHQKPDRVPLLANSLDPKFLKTFGGGDSLKAYEFLQLDVFPIRLQIWCQGLPLSATLEMEIPEEDQTAGGLYAGWNGIDEFGRIWKRGSYMGGNLKTREDVEKYIPSLRLEERTPPDTVIRNKELHPDKAFAFFSHLGPFGLTMESIGFEQFFYSLFDNRNLVQDIIAKRTRWFIEVCKYVVGLGVADFVVMGDDVAFKNNTFVSPKDFMELAIPYYKQIVDSVKIPLFWHSDGFIEPFIDLAIGAGIKGLHAIEPVAGNDLGRIKEQYGDRLVLLGNVDCVHVLTQPDLEPVRKDVDRCMRQAKKGGGFMIDSSNSIHAACNIEAVKEMYRYALEVGTY